MKSDNYVLKTKVSPKNLILRMGYLWYFRNNLNRCWGFFHGTSVEASSPKADKMTNSETKSPVLKFQDLRVLKFKPVLGGPLISL
jgi:hypothetical protein